MIIIIFFLIIRTFINNINNIVIIHRCVYVSADVLTFVLAATKQLACRWLISTHVPPLFNVS